jgi:hypothetical protein
MLWQVTLARCLRVRVPPTTTIALGISVWVLYVADRILDVMAAPIAAPSPDNDTARHRFYRQHHERAAPWVAALAILVVALALLWFPSALLRNYLVLAFGVGIYFGIVHAAPPELRARFPKELAVAVFFAFGVCLPVLTTSRWPLFAAFAALLWMNTLAIDEWEASRRKLSPLIAFCATLALCCAIAALLARAPALERALWAAIALSSALLAALGSFRFRLSQNALRVLADTALLTPLLLLPIISK